MTLLILLGFLALVAGLALVSRLRGARSHYLDEWQPDDGESILFEDLHVRLETVLSVSTYGSVVQPNAFVVVTNRRILAGQRPLFRRRLMILYMIYPGRAPGDEADSITGGEFRRGYRTLVVEPGAIERVIDAKKPFVELSPSRNSASSFNLHAFRIYTAKASSFPVPREAEATA